MELKKLIEELKNITEEDMPEINLQDDIEPEEPAEVIEAPMEEPAAEEPKIVDTMTLADQFDAKEKIARALENLKLAVDEFKDATAEKVDLIDDSVLLQEIEGLDTAVEAVATALASGNVLGDTELNDPFKAQQPAEDVTIDETPVEATEADDEEDEALLDVDFDELAGLDLLHNNDEE